MRTLFSSWGGELPITFPAIDPLDIYALLWAMALIAINAFFVASEFALVKARPSKLEELARRQRFGAAAVRKMMGNVDAYLSAAQLGVTVASLGLGWLGTPAVARLIGRLFVGFDVLPGLWREPVAFSLAFAILATLHISIGELLPKSVALARPEAVAAITAYPMRLICTGLFPIIRTVTFITSGLASLVGVPKQKRSELSEDEIRILLSQARSAGLLSQERAGLLQKALTLPTKSARHLMVPRNDVVFLDVNASLDENLKRAMESGHSMFPLCDGELDNVLGIVDIKAVLFALRDSANAGLDLRRVAAPATFLPEVMSGERLLAEFRARHLAMAIVVDEYGGASGMVAPSDVVSAVMGELSEDEEDLVALPGGAFDVDGTATLEEVQETLKVQLDGRGVATVAGFLMDRLGRMPKAGDRVNEAGLSFNVVEVSGPRVGKVRVNRVASR